MLKKEIKKIVKAYKNKVVGAAMTYFFITWVIFKLPYLNLMKLSFEWKMFIFYLVFIIWLNLSYNLLIILAILSLMFYQLGEISGVFIFISLLAALAKYFKDEIFKK